MIESAVDRLAMILAVDGEPFDTGHAVPLMAIFDRPSIDSLGQLIPVKNRKPEIHCLESDAELHELVKQSVVTRRADGATYVVRDFDPDGTGMTVITLGA